MLSLFTKSNVKIGDAVITGIWQPVKNCIAGKQGAGEHISQQPHGGEHPQIISLCIGCIKKNCSERSEINCCPVTVCAMRQVK